MGKGVSCVVAWRQQFRAGKTPPQYQLFPSFAPTGVASVPKVASQSNMDAGDPGITFASSSKKKE